MTRQISAAGIRLIKEHEGFMPTAYDDLDPKRALKSGDKIKGTLTVGYGHTGPDVYIGQTVTEDEAKALLDGDLDEAEQDVEDAVTVDLNDNQHAALVSIAYNIGGAAFAKSTLLRKLNAGDYDGAAREFPRWNKSKGKVLAGLVRRRAEEQALFLRPVTTVSDERPTGSPDDVKPGASGKAKAAAGAVVAAAGAAAVDRAPDAVDQISTGTILGVIGGVIILAVAAFYLWRKFQ